MVFTTYPLKDERPVTRAEIDRLTAIIEQLNDALDAAADREDRLRHELDVQLARADVAEALLRARASDDDVTIQDAFPRTETATGDGDLVVSVAMLEQ